jgi:hypothetical protein
VSADLGALDGFVEQSAGAVPALWGLVEDLRAGRARLAGLDLAGFPTVSAAGDLDALVESMAANQRFVADVADTLRQFGTGPGTGWLEVPWAVVAAELARTDSERLDELVRHLVAAGTDPAEAALIRAEVAKRLAADPGLGFSDAVLDGTAAHRGVTRAELERAGRALRLSRVGATRIVATYFDELAARVGPAGQITVADLIAVAGDPDAPADLRDAAYRLAADTGLFTDIDVAAQTDLTTVPFHGFDHARSDGIISRDDLAAFAVVDYRYRALAPWHPLLDTAAEGYDTTRTDSRVDSGDVNTFIADPDIPLHVRVVVYDLYRDRYLLIEPQPDEAGGKADRRSAPASELGEPKAGWAVPGGSVGTPLTTPSAGSSPTSLVRTGARWLSPFLVAGLAGWTAARPVALARTGDPGVAHVHPLTGRQTRFDLDALAGLTPTQRKAWVGHIAAYGQPPDLILDEPGPYPYLDEQGAWRWSHDSTPIPYLNSQGPSGDPDPYQADPPGTYRDANGNPRYTADNELWDGYLLAPSERRGHLRRRDLDADTYEIDGVAYQRHQVTFHPLCDDAGGHVFYRGQPLYRAERLGDSGIELNGSKTLIDTTTKGGWWHLDLENPPGHTGQLHLQYIGRKGRQQRHIYDFHTGTFRPSADGTPLSAGDLKKIMSHPDLTRALDEARRLLNVPMPEEGC